MEQVIRNLYKKQKNSLALRNKHQAKTIITAAYGANRSTVQPGVEASDGT